MWEHKKIAVVGVGGVYGYFGGLLAHKGLNISFLARNEIFDALKQFGLTIESIKQSFTIDPNKVEKDSKNTGPDDIVIVSVNSHQIDSIIDSIKPLVKKTQLFYLYEMGLMLFFNYLKFLETML